MTFGFIFILGFSGLLFLAPKNRTKYEYDAGGKRIAKIDPMGRRSLYGYDTRDRLTTEVDAEGRMVSHAYDAAGRKTGLTDGAGRIWRWVYDAVGRVVAEIDPLGHEVKSSYDLAGNPVLKTNARNQATGYEYDLMNRLVKVNYPDATAATFSYDALGRELVRSGAAGAVEKSYDLAGNLVSEKFINHNKAWNYSFDLMGNRIQAISPENETFRYVYDRLYRLTALETGKASEKITYAYDALGRNIETVRADSTTANKFDAAGQLLEMKHYRLVFDKDCGNQKKGKKNEPAYKEEILALRQYAYDLAGNRGSMTDEDGKVTVYAYDASNWLKQVDYPGNQRVSYTYNDAGDRLSEQTGSNPSVQYAYDAAGRMIGRGSESFSYDADGNMLTDAVATYTWNSDNRLVRVEKTLDACKHDKYRHGFGYGHLKHGKETTLYEEYSYLPEDWRRVSRKSGKYELSVKNRGFCRDNEEETFVSVYDGDDESQEYQLSTSKTGHRNKKETFRLNLLREFIGGPVADDLEHTRYNRLSLAMLKDGLGSTIAITGREAKVLADIDYDAWGNFRNQGKDSDLPCRHEDFDDYLDRFENTRGFGCSAHNKKAFGKYFADRLTPYLYTGRRYSDFTSQYFNRNRYYSPALGRFTSKDPIGFNGGMNLYRYADNNPIRWVDPWGLFKYLGTNWIFNIDKGKQAKIDDLEAGNSAWLVKWYGKYVIDANGRGYARPTIDVKKDTDSNCTVEIQTEMGITIYLPNIGEVAGRNVTDENLLKMIAEHEIGHEMMYRLIGERIFKSLEDSVNGKNLTLEEVDAKINEAKLKFYDEIREADSNYHSGNQERPFFEIDWSGFQK